MPPGLSAEWEAKRLSTWRAAHDPFFAELQAIEIRVLVWGPGQHAGTHYAKRLQVREHLNALSERTSAATSEELISDDERFEDLSVLDAEALHWRAADVVVVIIPRDHAFTGSRAEAAIFGQDESFRSKAFLIAPKLSARERKRASFLDQAAHDFDESHTLWYTDHQYEDCTRIRKFCETMVGEARGARQRKLIRSLPG